jgi:hypothetical protein
MIHEMMSAVVLFLSGGMVFGFVTYARRKFVLAAAAEAQFSALQIGIRDATDAQARSDEKLAKVLEDLEYVCGDVGRHEGAIQSLQLSVEQIGSEFRRTNRKARKAAKTSKVEAQPEAKPPVKAKRPPGTRDPGRVSKTTSMKVVR